MFSSKSFIVSSLTFRSLIHKNCLYNCEYSCIIFLNQVITFISVASFDYALLLFFFTFGLRVEELHKNISK